MTPATRGSLADRFAAAKAVADSVLYEGYVLYPYRASARKNKFRWQFGLLYPPGIGERSSARAECLLAPGGRSGPVVHVRARWLRVVRREVEEVVAGGRRVVEEATVDGELLVAWDEGEEVTVDLPPLDLVSGEPVSSESPVHLSEAEHAEVVRSRAGEPRAGVVRRSAAVDAVARAGAAAVGGGRYYKVWAEIVNRTAVAGLGGAPHNELSRHCLIGAHLMFSAEGGNFLSAQGPPREAAAAAAACRSEGLYPVLIGDGATVLASPIILYDFAAVAPETPGDFYDATEIDEILGLRVLTLTDAEKSEARATDARAAAVLGRCETMAADDWARLHGSMRPADNLAGPGAESSPKAAQPWWSPAADASVDPSSDAVEIAGVEVRRGSKVRLVPGPGADAQDMFLAGRVGTVEGVFTDVDGHSHLAVSLDGNPGALELGWQGRHFYFHPEEVEPLGTGPI